MSHTTMPRRSSRRRTSSIHHSDDSFEPEEEHAHGHEQVPLLQSARQRLLDDQVSFLIETRDNNKPHLYGPRSSTDGPLNWEDVAKLYNAKFNTQIRAAAVRKRVLFHREAWLAQHPGYPTDIVYTSEASKTRINSLKNLTDEDPASDEIYKARKARIGGWFPPESVRKAADIQYYFDRRELIDEIEYTQYIVLEVVDSRGAGLGNVLVTLADWRRTSAWCQRETEHDTDFRVRVTATIKSVIEDYVRFLSSTVWGSPVDLASVEAVVQLEVYCVAAQFEDAPVKGLLMGYWNKILNQDIKLALDADSLNQLFHSTEPDDPARDFWAETAHGAGVAGQLLDEKDCHFTLARKLRNLMKRGLDLETL